MTWLDVCACKEPFDADACHILAVADDVSVDAVKDGDTVPGPRSDLRRVNTGGEPGRDSGVPQVVRPGGQGAGGLRRGEGHLSCLAPGLVVRVDCDPAAVRASEEAPVGRRSELLDVRHEERDELRWAGDGPDVAGGPVFELAGVSVAAVVPGA